MIKHLRPALVMIALFTLITGFLLPVGFTAAGNVLLPYQSGGSLIQRDGKVIGSALIGQNFTSDKYFWGRPSALMGADPKDPSKQVATPYDAGESGASNLGPTNKALIDRVAADVAKDGSKPVPGDMVTTSGSGLDPDISPQTALRQVARVAKARRLSESDVAGLVRAHVRSPLLGFLGGARVNVLELNLALDSQKPSTKVAADILPAKSRISEPNTR
jgi:K+-transporting ATPase ATPase C chain